MPDREREENGTGEEMIKMLRRLMNTFSQGQEHFDMVPVPSSENLSALRPMVAHICHSGQVEQAIDLADAALNFSPENPVPQAVRAILALEIYDHSGAARELQTVLELSERLESIQTPEEEYTKGWRSVGRCLRVLGLLRKGGETSRALGELEESLEKEGPLSPQLYRLFAEDNAEFLDNREIVVYLKHYAPRVHQFYEGVELLKMMIDEEYDQLDKRLRKVSLRQCGDVMISTVACARYTVTGPYQRGEAWWALTHELSSDLWTDWFHSMLKDLIRHQKADQGEEK